jgi:hypothetical protein
MSGLIITDDPRTYKIGYDKINDGDLLEYTTPNGKKTICMYYCGWIMSLCWPWFLHHKTQKAIEADIEQGLLTRLPENFEVTIRQE